MDVQPVLRGAAWNLAEHLGTGKEQVLNRVVGVEHHQYSRKTRGEEIIRSRDTAQWDTLCSGARRDRLRPSLATNFNFR